MKPDEALKIVLDMSNITDHLNNYTVSCTYGFLSVIPLLLALNLKCLLLLRTCSRRCCVGIESFVSAKMQKVVLWKQ